MTLKDISQIFNRPGVWPGFMGGLAVPLAIIAMMNLPKGLVYLDLEASAGAIACLFITLPPLGALCSYGTANKRIRSQFMTGVTAPGLIIAAIILFNLSKKYQESSSQVGKLNKAVEKREEKLTDLAQKQAMGEETAIAEFQNGTEAQ